MVVWNINLSKTGYINEAGRCVVMHTTSIHVQQLLFCWELQPLKHVPMMQLTYWTWLSTLPKRI